MAGLRLSLMELPPRGHHTTQQPTLPKAQHVMSCNILSLPPPTPSRHVPATLAWAFPAAQVAACARAGGFVPCPHPNVLEWLLLFADLLWYMRQLLENYRHELPLDKLLPTTDKTLYGGESVPAAKQMKFRCDKLNSLNPGWTLNLSRLETDYVGYDKLKLSSTIDCRNGCQFDINTRFEQLYWFWK